MRPRFVLQQGRILVTQFPQPPPYTPATCVDEPVRPVSTCSVTKKAIAEIHRVDDSFHTSVKEFKYVWAHLSYTSVYVC